MVPSNSLCILFFMSPLWLCPQTSVIAPEERYGGGGTMFPLRVVRQWYSLLWPPVFALGLPSDPGYVESCVFRMPRELKLLAP